MFFKKLIVSQSMNIFDIHYCIPKLKRDNYKFWNEKVLLHFG